MSTNRVPYREDVTPGELRHALRGYTQMGYPIRGYTQGDSGMVTIIIMAPPGAQIPDWRTGAFGSPVPTRQLGWPAFNWRKIVQVLCVLAIVGAVGYIILGSGEALTDLVGDRTPNGEPVVEKVEDAPWWRFWDQEPAAEEEGAGWPLTNVVGDAVDGMIKQAAMVLVGLGTVLTILFVILFVRKAR